MKKIQIKKAESWWVGSCNACHWTAEGPNHKYVHEISVSNTGITGFTIRLCESHLEELAEEIKKALKSKA
jgi:hypothetical protein